MNQQPIDLEGIVHALDAVVFQAEGEPRAFSFVSRGAERLLGYPVSAWLSGPAFFDGLIVADDRDRVRATVAAAVAERGAYQLTYRLRAADGGVRWVRERAGAGTGTDGRVRLRGLLSDVTEGAGGADADRVADAEQIAYLQSINDLKDSFLAAVSHEMRNPLSAILGIALTLERSGARLSDDVAGDLVRRLAGNARKLDHLLTDLIDLDRLQRGMLLPERARTDLAALARRVVEETGVADDHDVTLEVAREVAVIDAAKTERILENLITNTRRHTPAGTPVWVRVRREGDGILLVVEDGGPGVPAGERETIFEPFHQADPPSSAGVGVGLSLVARFAELHGGRAWVTDRPGGGASFRVFLPDERAAQPHPARS